MPVRPPVSYPGVYVQEVPSGVQTITGVSTSIAAFLGMTRGGRLNTPKRILNFTDYVRAFGDDVSVGEMTDQVRLFFQNGGQQAWIMRIVEEGTARPAKLTLKDETSNNDVLTLTAKEGGMIGNQLRAEVNYDTPRPESSFNLRLYREVITSRGEVARESEESFTDLDMDPNSGRYVIRIVGQQSELVDASVPENISFDDMRFAGYSLSGLMINATEDIGDIVTAINNLISTGCNIQLSVDNSPHVIVALGDLTVDDGSIDFSTWLNPISTALAPYGVSLSTISLVNGPSNCQSICFTSANTEGGKVTITPAPINDAAAALQLGRGQGGLEVSGYAAQRPAPSGYFATLGTLNLAGATPLAALIAFAGANKTEFTYWRLADAGEGPHEHDISFPMPAGQMYVGSAFEATGVLVGSLLNVRENLRFLAGQIQANTDNNWQAAVHGLRLVLTPLFGGVNSDTTARLTSNDGTSGSGYNIGGDNGLFDNTADQIHQPNVRTYSFVTGGAGAYQTAVEGTEGNPPRLSDYHAAFDIIDREVDLFNLMILPRSADQSTDARIDVWGPASAFCQRKRAFLLMDPPANWQGVNHAIGEVSGVDGIEIQRRGVVKDHAALYWPRLTISANGGTKDVDPAGAVAGAMARTDAVRGVWKAPAGIEVDLRSVQGVTRMISDGENGLLNPQAINAIRVFPNGIVSWGARTMDGFDNSGNDDYKYIPIRRLALYIEESLYRGLKWVVFEPNDEPLWSQIRLSAGAFMQDLFRQGAFQGRNASDAYFVKCDGETTPPNDRNLGIVNIWVGFAPLKPAEFVILYLQQMAGQIQV